MTEIPEHLLKRSRERRAAIGGGGEGGESAAESEAPQAAATPATTEETTPAPAAAAVPAEPEPEPEPEPMRPEVEAYHRRRKIPYWAMPVLAALPLWGYVYQATLEPPPTGETDPVALGEAVYGSCASCHGATGQGSGAVPGLTEVLDTWPDYRDQMMWVKLGSTGWPGDTYGVSDTPKGGGMPEHPSLSDEELAQVVLYERTEFGGEEEADQEELIAIANGETTFADGGLGEESTAAGVEESELGGE